MWICNRLDLQTLGFQLVMPKNLPGRCIPPISRNQWETKFETWFNIEFETKAHYRVFWILSYLELDSNVTNPCNMESTHDKPLPGVKSVSPLPSIIKSTTKQNGFTCILFYLQEFIIWALKVPLWTFTKQLNNNLTQFPLPHPHRWSWGEGFFEVSSNIISTPSYFSQIM